MVIYIVTLVVVALALLASYRSFGGEPAGEADLHEFVGNVHEWVRSDARRIEFVATEETITDDAEDTAREVRKKLTGYQQQLNRLTESASERDPLSLSIEALNWTCRMVENGSCRLNPGVRDAAKDLYGYATGLLRGEVRDGAGDPVR